MTEKQINKILRPKMSFLFTSLILIGVAVLSYVVWNIRDKSLVNPEPLDFGTALMENTDEKRLYADSTLYSIMPFAEDEDGELYCFAMDDNDNFFIIKITEKTYDAIEAEYDLLGDDFQFHIKGYVNEISDDMRDFAITEYNSIFEDSEIKLTEFNFKYYVGDSFLDETIHPQDGFCVVLMCIGFISGFIAFIMLIFFIVNSIRFNMFRSKNDMDLIRYELAKENVKAFPKLGAYLTDKYIFAKGNTFLSIVNYNDILWMYSIKHSINSIPINVSLVGRTQNGRQVTFGIAVKESVLDELAEEICVHNPNMLLGYTAENISKFKELTGKKTLI